MTESQKADGGHRRLILFKKNLSKLFDGFAIIFVKPSPVGEGGPTKLVDEV